MRWGEGPYRHLSNAPSDRRRAMELGATDYFRKPTTLEQFMELGPKSSRCCRLTALHPLALRQIPDIKILKPHIPVTSGMQL